MDNTVATINFKALFNDKEFQAGIKRLFKSFDGIKKKTNIFNKFLKFAGFAGFTKMAIDAAQFGKSMSLLAERTGIAVDKLTSMRTAFSALGASAKSVDNLLDNITSGLARLSSGNGEFASKLSAMGISAWNNKGNIKQANEVMGDLANWTKSQLAMGRSMSEVSTYLKDNFGIEQEMVNQLALGRAGMEAEIAKQNNRTGTVSGSEIANLESLNKSLSTFKTTIGVLVNKIMAGLAPAIEFFADLFTIIAREVQDIFGELFGAFSDVIGGGEEVAIIFAALKKIIQGLVDAIKITIDIFALIGAVFRKFGEWMGNLIAWLQNSWIGKAFGVKEQYSTEADSMEERINKQEKEGKITHEQANKLRERLGIGKKDSLFSETPTLTTRDLITGEEIDMKTFKPVKNSIPVEIAGENYDEEELLAEKPKLPENYGAGESISKAKQEKLFKNFNDAYLDGTAIENDDIESYKNGNTSTKIIRGKDLEKRRQREEEIRKRNADLLNQYRPKTYDEYLQGASLIGKLGGHIMSEEEYNDAVKREKRSLLSKSKSMVGGHSGNFLSDLSQNMLFTKKDEFKPELNGNEVTKADNSGSVPVVNLEVNTNAEFNEATGQVEQKVDINGQSENSSGAEPINYMYQSVRG